MPHLLVKTTIAAMTLGLFGVFAEADAMPRLSQDGLTNPVHSIGYYGRRYGGYRNYGHSNYGYRNYGYRNYGYRYGGYGRGYGSGYGNGGYGRGCGGGYY